ncbi:glycosyltransferase family 4 protein [Thalassotalea psychrophila]|uniref:Glycosyltransferase family 4 protein n=1 Tax=Thalassotalea psychrophila TaxID=3065647 RepID=A0ABY9TQU1_9GAMM|nr:glycosyltransferase family 4 protein [Colwelliaceae bacterium SQ149]
MKKVVIVQHRLLHYRVDLFNLMKKKLKHKNVELHLVHGGASAKESQRKDEGHLTWANKIKNYFCTVSGVDLIWQKLPNVVNECELLVLMQENRIISNYPQIIKRKLLKKKIAFWGHGKNLQSTKPEGIKELWKLKWLTSVDWWFGYTKSTVDYLVNKSFPERNITCLNNAIDIDGFKDQLANISNEDLERVRSDLGIEENSVVGIYCGSLYKEKRLNLMLEAADYIKTKNKKFHLVIIGDGPDAHILKNASQTRDWLSLVGVKKGQDKALFYRLSHIFLNPGLVGLHILDSFAVGIPMITTEDALHSPEYDYLENDINGLVLPGNAKDYAIGIIELLNESDRYKAMCDQALNDSEKYTVESMANNFVDGIVKCLSD